jgi:hypothetical protein
LKAGDDRLRQEQFAFPSLQFTSDFNRVLIDAPAFWAGIIIRAPPLELDAVPSPKLLVGIEQSK